jgi:hypothetical protein
MKDIAERMRVEAHLKDLKRQGVNTDALLKQLKKKEDDTSQGVSK